jgi:hypothetical protein
MKQETLEEGAKKQAEFNYGTTIYGIERVDAFVRGSVFGAKWQAERMYSEKDLREAFKGGGKMSWTDINQETQEPYYYDFNDWFEQFEKK